jgi:hypothetical protein
MYAIRSADQKRYKLRGKSKDLESIFIYYQSMVLNTGWNLELIQTKPVKVLAYVFQDNRPGLCKCYGGEFDTPECPERTRLRVTDKRLVPIAAEFIKKCQRRVNVHSTNRRER